MTLCFSRPVGASADIRELEYVSALLQTNMPNIRADASLRPTDIVRFLSSRYGICATEVDVRRTILHSLGGGDEEEEVIDITEMVAILLIPTLIKAVCGVLGDDDDVAVTLKTLGHFDGHENEYKRYREVREKLLPPKDFLRDVWAMMLTDVGVVKTDKELEENPTTLNTNLVRRMLLSAGLDELSDDDNLLQEMVRCAGRSDERLENVEESQNLEPFNVKALARAVAGDVLDYDPDCEASVTTNFADVFKSESYLEVRQGCCCCCCGRRDKIVDHADGGGNESVADHGVELGNNPGGRDNEAVDVVHGHNRAKGSLQTSATNISRIRTFPFIDFVAETYRSKALVTALWTGFIMYFLTFQGEITEKTSVDCGETFGCTFGNSFLAWLEIFAGLCITGLMYVCVGSFGNEIQSNHKFRMLFSMVIHVCYTTSMFYKAFRPYDDHETLNADVNNTDVDVEDDFKSELKVKAYGTAERTIEEVKRILCLDRNQIQWRILYYMGFAVGCTIFILQLNLFLGKFIASGKDRIPTSWLQKFLAHWFTPGCIIAESRIKQAAAYKINHLVKNALKLHEVSRTKKGTLQYSKTKSLLKYAKLGRQHIPQGGFLWTLKRIRTGEICSEDGIWLSGRILAGCGAQFLSSFFVLAFGIQLTKHLRTEFKNDFTVLSGGLFELFSGTASVIIDKGTLFLEAFFHTNVTPVVMVYWRDFVSAVRHLMANGTSADIPPVEASMLSNRTFPDIWRNVSEDAFAFYEHLEHIANLSSRLIKQVIENETKRNRDGLNCTDSLEEILKESCRGMDGNSTDGTIEEPIKITEDGILYGHSVMTNSALIGTERHRLRMPEDRLLFNEKSEICQNMNVSHVCELIDFAVENSNFFFKFDLVESEIMDSLLSTTNETIAFGVESFANQSFSLTEVIMENATPLVIDRFLPEAFDVTIETIKPTHLSMVTIPMYAATISAFLTLISVMAFYIPSTASTILKMRCGIIPTFRDPEFTLYRIAPHEVTNILGYMFWGGLLSAGLMGSVIGLIVFLVVWRIYHPKPLVIAMLLGLALAYIVKFAIFLCLRCSYYKAFYRTRPAPANLLSLALEATNFGVSVLFVFIRYAKIIVSTLIYIGRIDTPFLAPDVGSIGPMKLDNTAVMFRKTILAHEAHRHPYIETLGTMFLMKLHYGDRFGKAPNSCWRLLLVLTLMPWLDKYRLMSQKGLQEREGEEDESVETTSFHHETKKPNFALTDQGDVEDMDKHLLIEEISVLREEIQRLRKHRSQNAPSS